MEQQSDQPVLHGVNDCALIDRIFFIFSRKTVGQNSIRIELRLRVSYRLIFVRKLFDIFVCDLLNGKSSITVCVTWNALGTCFHPTIYIYRYRIPSISKPFNKCFSINVCLHSHASKPCIALHTKANERNSFKDKQRRKHINSHPEKFAHNFSSFFFISFCVFQKRSHGYQRTHKRGKHLIRDRERMWVVGPIFMRSKLCYSTTDINFFFIYKNKIDT